MASNVPAAAHDNQLKRNALGLPSALAISLAFISPTIGVLFISALIAGKAGVSSPFVFIIGTVGIALMASTLAQFATRVTSAGTFYKFISQSFGATVAFMAAMLLLLGYVLQGPLNIDLFGSFVSNLVAVQLGISIPWWLFAILIVVLIGILAWYSVHTSMRFDLAFVIAEVSVVTALLILILVEGGDHGQVPTAFLPTHAPGGAGALGNAFVFIIFAFFGFESCTTVAEETRNPRRTLPIALVGSVLLAGLYFTFAMYTIVVGYGAKHIGSAATASSPVIALAERYIGHWYGVIVDLAAVSAIIAVLLAIHTANFRLIYCLGRDRALPSILGVTHVRYRTPTRAILAFSTFALGLAIVAGLYWGPMNAFGDLGFLSSLAIIPIYVATNTALTFFIYRRYRAECSILLHLIFPTLSSAIFAYAFYLDVNPYPTTSPTNIFPVLLLGFTVIVVIAGLVLRRRNSPILLQLTHVLFVEETAIDPIDSPTSPVTPAR